jgi:hypothetical protein
MATAPAAPMTIATEIDLDNRCANRIIFSP